MYILKHIEIDGFWGKEKLSVDLQSDVNIFIGPNGTGKTTLINALQASMTFDVQLLNALSFSCIKIGLMSGKSSRKIIITKYPTDGVFDLVEYRISREVFKVPLIPRDIEYRRRLPPRHIEKIHELREKLAELSETSWLSVHRELLEEEGYETHLRGRRVEEILNPIDARLFRLLEKLQTYQMRLQSEANILSVKFQRDVLTSLLYNKSFDSFDLEKESEIDYIDLKNNLNKAYDALGVLTDGTKKRIDNHINIIQESISKLINNMNSNINSFPVNDILPLSLLKRSRHLARLSTENDKEKKVIFEQLDLFIKTLRIFLADKEIELDVSAEGGMKFSKKNMPLRINDLSSGEKQVFILLTETLLQERRNAIFLADEPELSLHIAWQRILISAMRTLNPNTQMIVATHSPEIAGDWKASLIDMQDILS